MCLLGYSWKKVNVCFITLIDFFFADTFQEANRRVIALTSSRPPACNPNVSISFEGGRGLRLKFPSSTRKYPGESSSGGECGTAEVVKPPPAIHKPRNVLGGPLVNPRGFMRPFTGPPPSTLSIYQGIFFPSYNFFFLIFFLGLPPRGRDLQGNQQAEGKFFLNVKKLFFFSL